MKKIIIISLLVLSSSVFAKDMTIDIGTVSDNTQSPYDGDRCSAKVAKNLKTGTKTIRFSCSDEHIINFVSLYLSKEQAQEMISLLEESIETMDQL
tara:strand:- start:3 stop:290 length:288 start_codon:yes stop_codon:yes gene_type:complete